MRISEADIRVKKFRYKIIMLFILIVVLSSVLLFQYYRINSINLAIRELEKDLQSQQFINDSLEGEILAKQDLDRIGSIAINQYGMVKPNASQYTYVSLNENNVPVSDIAAKGNGLIGWFYDLIQ